MDGFLADTDPIMAEQLRLALKVLEHWPSGLRFSRFSRLSVQARQQVLADWTASGLTPKRQIAVAVSKTALFTHYARPQVWPAIGYDGPMLPG